MNFLTDNVMTLLEKSSGFLWTKQAALLDNIANAETPNYKAKVVTFEQSLREQLEVAARRPETVKQRARTILENADFAVFEPQEAIRMDNNGVNITDQMVELTRNAYQQQYVYNAISSEFNILRMAIRGQ